jgi:hypothetical protein
VLDIIDIGGGEEWGSAGGEGERDLKEDDVLRMSLPSGGEEATLGEGCPERDRENNGRIMGGRDSGVDDWWKRRWMREDGGCRASGCLSVMVLLLVMF